MQNIKSFRDLSNERLNEDNTGSAFTSRDQIIFTPGSTTILDGSLFKLGKAEIDTNNPQFKKAVALLKPLGSPIIVIEGGASAVGNDKGFDNVGLAKKRAENFIKALKGAGVDTDLYQVKASVGKATVPNSKEANAEQFVKIIYQKAPRGQYINAIDNATAVKQINKIPVPIEKIKMPTDRPFVILKVFYDEGTKDKVIDSIVKSTKPLKTVVRDVTGPYYKKKYTL
jgi:hypothetical protein